MKFGQIFGSGSLGGHRANATQRPVPGDFLLFKRCEWLVFNWTPSARQSNFHTISYPKLNENELKINKLKW